MRDIGLLIPTEPSASLPKAGARARLADFF
jgi:hypothetical protein